MIYTPSSPVSLTVYSLVFNETEKLIKTILSNEQEIMLARHRNAHLKHQDPMHDNFFSAWQNFSKDCVNFKNSDYPETYPSNGSSEAIFHILAHAKATNRDLVVFEADYEGYRSLAESVGVRVHIVNRNFWRETLEDWREGKTSFANRPVQWWVSQPSAIDGNIWSDFPEWLKAMEEFSEGNEIWVDLTYVGRASIQNKIELTSPIISGFVFSLSKVMGAYYRRIGGCYSRLPIPSLWGNRWFKNLDSLYIGERWLQEASSAFEEGLKMKTKVEGKTEQEIAIEEAFNFIGNKTKWENEGIFWKPSDVSLLMYAEIPQYEIRNPELLDFWTPACRGLHQKVSARLCLTPTLAKRFGYQEEQ